MVDNSEFERFFAGVPLMAILRGMGVERSLAVATAAWDLGIEAVEIPIQRPDDVRALEAVVDVGRARGKRTGAGTVLTPEHVRQAAAAGAEFTVSPGFDLTVTRASADAGLLPLPGVATATEVQHAMTAGLTWLKAFPASLLGPSWFRAMRGPFPPARFVATGGMDAANAGEFLDAGVPVVSVGSALEDEAQLPALAELMAGRGVRL